MIQKLLYADTTLCYADYNMQINHQDIVTNAQKSFFLIMWFPIGLEGEPETALWCNMLIIPQDTLATAKKSLA